MPYDQSRCQAAHETPVPTPPAACIASTLHETFRDPNEHLHFSNFVARDTSATERSSGTSFKGPACWRWFHRTFIVKRFLVGMWGQSTIPPSTISDGTSVARSSMDRAPVSR
jgi:hypothetical protein